MRHPMLIFFLIPIIFVLTVMWVRREAGWKDKAWQLRNEIASLQSQLDSCHNKPDGAIIKLDTGEKITIRGNEDFLIVGSPTVAEVTWVYTSHEDQEKLSHIFKGKEGDRPEWWGVEEENTK